MDDLCELIADKFGMTFDAAGDWLAVAVPQYAQMMMLKYAMNAAGFGIVLAVAIAIVIFVWRGLDKPGIVSDNEYGFGFVFIVACMAIVIALAVVVITAPLAVMWGMTPDGMLLHELVGKVM